MHFLAVFLLSLPLIALGSCPQNPLETRKQADRIQAEIDYHNDLYYNQFQPVISDHEFDALKARLEALQDCLQEPVSRSPKPATSQNTEVAHQSFMGSLRKARDSADVEAFFQMAGEDTVLLQPKIDGIAIELVYRKGQLVSASTRGDGHKGSNILDKVEHIQAIPLEIHTDNPEIVLHGELFTRLDLWQDTGKYASARHYTAGLINSREPDAEALADMDFFPWHWPNSPFEKESHNLNVFYSLGFDLPTLFTYKVSTLKEAETIRAKLHQSNQAKQKEKSQPFLLDGVVLKLDNLSLRKSMGWQSGAPKWALAWKFPSDSAVSKVTQVDFRIGRTGNITPVLQIEPVAIQGETISRVSLGSVGNLKRKDVAVGDQVSVVLKGAAIPVFGRVLVRAELRQPSKVPDQHRYNNFTCLSYTAGCEQQFLARLKWLAGKNGLALPWLDEPVIATLIGKGLVKSLADLLQLDADTLMAAGLNPEQTLELKAALQAAHTTSFIHQLRALSLPGVGLARSKSLAAHYQGWEQFLNAATDEAMRISGMGPAEWQSMKEYLKQPQVTDVIHFLHKPAAR